MTRLGLILMVLVGACGDDDGGMPPDLTAPTIVSRTPDDGDTNVYVNDPIVVTFSEPIANNPAISVAGAEGMVSWSPDRTTVTVTLTQRPPAPWTATIMISLAADAAGNAMGDTSWSWELPQWQQPGSELNRVTTAAAGAPVVAQDGAGHLVVAWQEAGGIYASRLGDDSAWEPLGGANGISGQSTTPAVAVDAQDRPVLGWVESDAGFAGTVKVSRWDGTAWAPLPSPGMGAGLAMARDAGGTVYLATQGTGVGSATEVAVFRLAGDTWESLGGPTTSGIAGATDAPPTVAIAVGGNSSLYLAWVVDTGASGKELRTARSASSATWDVLSNANRQAASIARSPNLTVDADGVPVLAWEEFSGVSYDARVARLNDRNWQQIGRPLDIDPVAEGRWPSVVVAPDGTLFASWAEHMSRQRRVWVAREVAGAWELVGGQALNREVGSFAALPHMVVQNGWPTVAWQEWQSNDFMLSKVWVRRYNGNDLRLPGLENRASSAGCRLDPSADLMLSQTGCFDSLGIDPVAMAGLVPFDLNSHLWSDGALKRRWLVIPDGQTITRTDTGGWSVPVGTMVVKEFALNMVDGDATSRRPVETRFLVKDDADNNWSGYSYQWNESFTDAMLLPGAPETKDWMITTSDGGTRNHTHTYPGRGQCLTCHNLAAGILLGVQSKQLDRRLDYDGIADNQLEAMDRIGMFSAPLDNLPSDPVIPPSDLGFPREPRMRAYLATNCAHCHSPGGIRPTRDFRWETVLDLPGDDPAEASTRMCGSDAEIVPGNAAGSLLFQRMSTRPTGGMPPLATLIVDPFALDLIGSWINGVTAAACP